MTEATEDGVADVFGSLKLPVAKIDAGIEDILNGQENLLRRIDTVVKALGNFPKEELEDLNVYTIKLKQSRERLKRMEKSIDAIQRKVANAMTDISD